MLGLNRTIYVEQRVGEYRAYWERAAQTLSATFIPLSETVWEIRLNGCSTRVASHVVPLDDPVTHRLAGDRAFCYRTAQQRNIPVPAHRVFRLASLDSAHAFMVEHPGAAVVKPVSGTSAGIGVTTCIRTAAQLENAAALASLFCEDLLIESMVPAESCRLLYLDGQLLHAVRRRGVRVTGDGRSAIGQLLERRGHRLRSDLVTALTLRAQRLSLDTVLEPGREVVARSLPAGETRATELRTVYDESITDLVCPALRDALGEVVRVVGSKLAGVDVLTNNPSMPLEDSGGAFLEINTTPGLHHHYITAEEQRTHPVTVRVLEYLLREQSGRDGETAPVTIDPVPRGRVHTADYVRRIGVPEIPPSTSPFDPGYDPATVQSHLDQSAHLMSILKISMAGWLIARESATRRKIAAARRHQVPTVTGGGPFEVAVAQGQLPAYLDLCADFGVTRIEAGEGFTVMPLRAGEVVAMARERGLELQFELGQKRGGAFTEDVVEALIEQGRRWLDAGAVQLVVEARESAQRVGLFDAAGALNREFAERFAAAFGLATVTFEAPNKSSQFALLEHFGREVRLGNVRLEELLRVEIYRRGLHSDAFSQDRLRPRVP